MNDKIIAIPDIHGNYRRLKILFDRLEEIINLKEYLIIFLGDYIDRGKESNLVIDFLIKLKEKYNCKFLLGNHEDMMLKGIIDLDNNWLKDWLNNGAIDTLKCYLTEKQIDIISKEIEYGLCSYCCSKVYNVKLFSEILIENMPKEHLDFFKSLELCYEIDKFVFVHAGVDLDKPLNENTVDDFTWIRPEFYKDKKPKHPINKLIIHGHTPVKFIILSNKYHIGIDFKCYDDKNGYLVCFDPNKMKVIWSVGD